MDDKNLPSLACYQKNAVCWTWHCFLNELVLNARKYLRAVNPFYSTNPSVTVSFKFHSLYFTSCSLRAFFLWVSKTLIFNLLADNYLQIKEAHVSCLKFNPES